MTDDGHRVIVHSSNDPTGVSMLMDEIDRLRREVSRLQTVVTAGAELATAAQGFLDVTDGLMEELVLLPINDGPEFDQLAAALHAWRVTQVGGREAGSLGA